MTGQRAEMKPVARIAKSCGYDVRALPPIGIPAPHIAIDQIFYQ
jgi:hypothetical protein